MMVTITNLLTIYISGENDDRYYDNGDYDVEA